MTLPFYNISNHPVRSATGEVLWSEGQLRAAQELGNGEVLDIVSPNVDPYATTEDVVAMAKELAAQVPAGATVHVMGDFTLTVAMVRALRERGCRPMFATTYREVQEAVLPDGAVRKTAVFRFVTFRDAP